MSKVQEKYQISPIFVFFLIHGAQFGAGVLGFARIIAKYWIRRMDGSYNHRNFHPYSYMDDVCLIKRNKWEFS